MPRAADKAALRRKLRALRDGLSDADVRQRSRALCERVVQLASFERAAWIAGYAAFGREADLSDALQTAHARGKRLALPRLQADGTLSLRAFSPGDPLELHRFGIPEPPESAAWVDLAEVGLVLVPALGIDPRGRRIGHGKGYYDRLLPLLQGATRVGTIFELQLVDSVPTEPHDVRLDCIVTECRTLQVAD